MIASTGKAILINPTNTITINITDKNTIVTRNFVIPLVFPSFSDKLSLGIDFYVRAQYKFKSF